MMGRTYPTHGGVLEEVDCFNCVEQTGEVDTDCAICYGTGVAFKFVSGFEQRRVVADQNGVLGEVVSDGIGAHLERVGDDAFFLSMMNSDGSEIAVDLFIKKKKIAARVDIRHPTPRP